MTHGENPLDFGGILWSDRPMWNPQYVNDRLNNYAQKIREHPRTLMDSSPFLEGYQ